MNRVVARTLLLASMLVVTALLVAVYAGRVAADTPSPSPSPSESVSPSPSPSPPPPVTVISVSPRDNAKNVAFSSPIRIVFSTPLAADTPLPVLSPKVPGIWVLEGTSSLVFKPAGHLRVYATERLTIPSGSAGVHGLDGSRLVSPWTSRFTVRGPSSVLRLQQLLAELGYLPLRFKQAKTSPAATATSGASAGGTRAASGIAAEPRNADLVSVVPVRGTFKWHYQHIPKALSRLWKRGRSTVFIRGAVMTFELDHHLTTDGVAGRSVWLALLKATAGHKIDKRPYDYIQVSMHIPETLSVWQNGRVIFTSRTNTGIPSRPTEKGTFPVYLRFRSVTMSGTNPDGTPYNDPGVPYVAYFNGGDAVHGFIRGSYGYPQSLGCVELPYGAAATVFPHDPIGTLVACY